MTETKVVCDGKSVHLVAELDKASWIFKDESKAINFYCSLTHVDQLTKMMIIALRKENRMKIHL